ncbi:hypothetical protein [Flavobacterium sp. UBA6031]|uniref:hypothetical protein n=1 Tax=Flavobacterium sp. UBA6031 TaxID=1946551 RepID=UPI0025B982C3|nr:hypothetical protein [Flavobacterium sp. UBA6031]
MINTKHWKNILIAGLLWAILPAWTQAQMNMNPYFTAISYPVDKQSLMLMAMPDFQTARYGNNFVTGMLMAEYGITSRWTVAIMTEGQKIAGMDAAYGGIRIGTYFHLLRDERLLNLTLYGEYEDLNGAALYKMEIAGFGSGDLTEPLALAREKHVRTFEQRLILYHDWNRLNVTFNFIRETFLQTPYGSDYGYALGLFFRSSWMGGSMKDMKGMEGMEGMADMTVPPVLSISRLGYGFEMIGALGNNHQFGFDWNAQQHYLGAVLQYTLSSHWSVRVEPSFGLSNVSDPFMLRTGLTYMFGTSTSKAMKKDQ